MKISEVIAALDAIRTQHGDLVVTHAESGAGAAARDEVGAVAYEAGAHGRPARVVIAGAPAHPVLPALRAIDVVVFDNGVPVAGADVYVDDLTPPGGHEGSTDQGGFIHFDVSPLPQSYVRVTCDGYEPYEQHVDLTSGNQQIRIGLGADADRPDDLILAGLTRIKPIMPALVAPPIHGRLRSNGPRLFDDSGPWKWKMATAFDALRLLITGGEDALTPYLSWLLSIGGNGIRVFCNWQVTGLDFRQVPDYMNSVRKLCRLTETLGLRVDCCAVCDFIPPGLAAQQAFINELAATLAEFVHVDLVFGNEPYKNMENPARIATPNVPLLMARGMCDPNDPHALPYLPSAGFTVYQTVRSADWMRKVGKDGFEIRNGFTGFAGTHDACINTEMIGAAETISDTDPNAIGSNGRRSNDKREFFMAGIAAAMFTSGATAHGDALTMQRCVVPGPREASCASELFRGIDLVPIDAPTWAYTRFGPAAPPVPMPVEPDPIDGNGDDVRIHAMVGPAQAVSVNYRYLLPRHDAWAPRGINGWRTVLQDGPYVLSERA